MCKGISNSYSSLKLTEVPFSHARNSGILLWGTSLYMVITLTASRHREYRKSFLLVDEEREARERAWREKKKMEKLNKEIKDKMKLEQLNKQQQEMVNQKQKDFDQLGHLKLLWRDLSFIELLGSGSFGDVFKGSYGGKSTVAIKRIRAGLVDQESLKAFENEVFILASVRHPNLVRFIGFTLQPALLIVLEFADHGTLMSYIEKKANSASLRGFSFSKQLQILSEVAKAIDYLHGRNPTIMHRDVKSENIFLDGPDYKAVLGDLGEAKMLDGKKLTIVGT